jgi:hypothetical protein
MRLTGHQLLWAFAQTLSNPAAKESAVVQEELQQTKVDPRVKTILNLI